jgi:hypothetical protein
MLSCPHAKPPHPEVHPDLAVIKKDKIKSAEKE